MGPVRLGVGTQWLLDGRAWRVVRQLSSDRFIALDAKFNREEEFSRQAILNDYAEGRLQFAAVDVPVSDSETRRPGPRTIDDLNDRDKQLLLDRWHVIEPLAGLPHRPNEADFSRRAAELEEAGKRYSARTIRRYWKAWHRAGKDRLALLPSTPRAGGRGRSRRHGWLERYPILKRLVEEAIQEVYLNKARRPISAVTRRVLEDIQRLNTRIPAAQALPVPREATLGKAIARRIAQLDPWELDRARWGKQIADRRHAPKSSLCLATRILERVEIDHSPLKIVVGTEAGPIGQPWLTILIDYHSRMIVGFCLGFEPPSYAVIMEALRHAILPKNDLSQRYPKIRGTWPCYGLPEKLVCDRGSDFTSSDLENAAFQLGIELDFNPPRTPHFKGTVESFFDGLSDQLIAALPGRTFRSWEKRADYKPDDGPLIPYEALLEIIHIHLVDVYSISKHPASHRTRLEIWQESAADHPPCLPTTPDELIVLLAKRVERTLLPRGIELNGMFYTSDELMALRAELAANNLQQRRMQVRYNPWDLGNVWVLNPLENSYLKASAVDATLKDMTEYQWKVLRRAVRERFDRPDHLMNLAAGRNAVRQVVEETLQKPSRKRRARAARYLQRPPSAESGSSEIREDAWVDVPANHDVRPDATISTDGPSMLQPPEETSADSQEELDPADINVDDWDIAGPDV